jgi:hypothetical protein
MKNRVYRIFLFIILFMAFINLTGCYYDVSQELYPLSGNCDTSNVSFSGDINPFLQQKCISCHGAGSGLGGVNLEGYAMAKIYADNGKLIGTISHANGYVPMPQGEGPVSTCSVNMIKAWINHGTPNN